jgi:hypothetical protein
MVVLEARHRQAALAAARVRVREIDDEEGSGCRGSSPGYFPNAKRRVDWLRTAAVGVIPQTAPSSSAAAAMSSGTSEDAEACMASATINAAVVEPWTADRPLCRFVQRRACARLAWSEKMTSPASGCSKMH